MGWNSWNSGISLTERSVEETIDAMVSSGMRDAGYRYVNLDAGWAAPTRDADGNLRADPVRFPHGIAAVARYAHDRGMYLGIYHSPFNEGCGQDPRIGGAGHEEADAHVFAAWGVDYLKYDWSHIADVARDGIDLVPAWGDANLWAEGLAGVSQAFTKAGPLAAHNGPAHVNDPDMLVVGIPWAEFVTRHPTMAMGPPRPDLTEVEQRAHFSLWAMLAAPLLAGNDVRSMVDTTRAILTNREVIAVDQDPLVLQGLSLPTDGRVIVKPLADGSVAVALFNGDSRPAAIGTNATEIGVPDADCYAIRDLWEHANSTTTGAIARTVPSHGVAMLRVTAGCQ